MTSEDPIRPFIDSLRKIFLRTKMVDLTFCFALTVSAQRCESPQEVVMEISPFLVVRFLALVVPVEHHPPASIDLANVLQARRLYAALDPVHNPFTLLRSALVLNAFSWLSGAQAIPHAHFLDRLSCCKHPIRLRENSSPHRSPLRLLDGPLFRGALPPRELLRSGDSVERRHCLETRIAALFRDAAKVQGFKARNSFSANSHPGPLPLGEGESRSALLAWAILCGGGDSRAGLAGEDSTGLIKLLSALDTHRHLKDSWWCRSKPALNL